MEVIQSFYPIYINLFNKACLVVGGGIVAARKVENLLEYGAKVSLVSPEVIPAILNYADIGLITLYKRKFAPNDLEDIFMVYIATDDNEINHSIAQLCQNKRILVNAVDDPPNCDFFVPAIVKRGSLSMAISTTGKSPILAKQIKTELENLYGEEYSEYVDLLGEYREIIKSNIPDINIRHQIFKALIDLDIIDLLKAGKREKVRERMEQCISSWQD